MATERPLHTRDTRTRAGAAALLLAALFTAGGCALQREAPPAPPPPVSKAQLERLYAELPPRRAPGQPGHEAARAWLEQTLVSAGLTPRWLPAAPPGWDGPPLRNLEVRLGADPAKPLLLLGAHYDTVPQSPGADDNGSGTVALLALARRFARRELPVELALVFFDGEELGLLGSWRYARELPERERARLMGMINLETMAYRDRRPGSQALPPGFELLLDPGDVGDFIAVIGNIESRELVQRVDLGLRSEADAGLRSVAYGGVPGRGWLVPDTRRSDHASFWDIGVPAVMLTDTANFRNPHYHRPGDRVETLDLEFLAAIVRGVERAVLLLAGEAAEGREAPAG